MNRSVGAIDFSLLIFFRNLNSIAKHFYRASTVYSPANFTIIYIYIYSYSFDQIWAKIYTQAACKDINLFTCNDIYTSNYLFIFFLHLNTRGKRYITFPASGRSNWLIYSWLVFIGIDFKFPAQKGWHPRHRVAALYRCTGIRVACNTLGGIFHGRKRRLDYEFI